MKRSRKRWSNSGFTLIEIMIASGMLGMLALGMSQLMSDGYRQNRRLQGRSDLRTAYMHMQQILADENNCLATLGGIGAVPTNAFDPANPTVNVTDVPAIVQAAGPVNRFVDWDDDNTAIYNNIFIVQEMSLHYDRTYPGPYANPVGPANELRPFEIRVEFDAKPNANTPIGGRVDYIPIMATVTPAGVISECYTNYDATAAAVCGEMGGTWDVAGNPHRCVIRDVTTDYVCEELGGTVNLGARRAPEPQRGTPLPNLGDGSANDPYINPANRTCDLSAVTNQDACRFVMGELVDAGENIVTINPNNCRLANEGRLREMACAMAGGTAINGGPWGQYSGAGNAGSEAGTLCRQTTWGACQALGGTPSDDNEGAPPSCAFTCDTNVGADTLGGVENIVCGEQMCNDLGGVWNQAPGGGASLNQCDITQSNTIKQLACENSGYVWNGTTCEWGQRYDDTCAGFGGTWTPSQDPNGECRVGGDRYDDWIRQMVCLGISIEVNDSLLPGSASHSSATPVFTSPNSCDIVINTDFLNLTEADSRYRWKGNNTNSITMLTSTFSDAGTNSIAIGAGASAGGSNSIAIGSGADSGSSSSTLSIGAGSSVTSTFGTAVGTTSGGWVTTSGYSGTSVGFGANSAFRSTSIGTVSSASGDYASGLGRYATPSGNYSTSVGNESTASGTNSIAVGHQSSSSATSSVAIGNLASATTDYSTSLGYDADATGSWSTAIGGLTDAPGTYGTAVGYDASANGTWSTSMGYQALASSGSSTAYGYQANAGGWGASFGSVSVATGTSSAAHGTDAQATGYRSTSIGSNSRAGGSRSVSIGSQCSHSGGNAVRICRNGNTNYMHFSGTTWTYGSTRRKKTNFELVDPTGYLDKLLQLPIYFYNMLDKPNDTKILGPVAEEYYDIYQLGESNETINSGEINAIALLAIQDLAKKMEKRLKEQEEKIEKLERELASAREEIEDLKGSEKQ